MNMKRTYLLLSLLLFSNITYSSPYVISGFDDVLRQAENTGLIKAGLKLFEKDQGFVGMSHLYTSLTRNDVDPKFSLVSAISSSFEKRIDTFLKNEKYPIYKSYLRSWLTQWSIESFKIESIDKIMSRFPERSFLVIFDNSSASLNLATKLKQKYRDSIDAIYLRQVANAKSSQDYILYYTAFDIAFNEFKEKRLSEEDVISLGELLLKEKNLNKIIPTYA
jgi:phosphatidate phosphatase APP1